MVIADSKDVWFTAYPIGKNTLSNFVKDICKEAKVNGKKTNHSLRATGVSNLFQAGVLEKLIQQRLGHHSLEGLRQYQRTSLDQEKTVSRLLTSGSTVAYQQLSMQAEAQPQQPSGLNNNFSGCSVTIYQYPSPLQPQTATVSLHSASAVEGINKDPDHET